MLRLRTFGGLALTRDSGPLSGAASQPRRLALLAALAVAGEQGLSRDKLLGLLWPETTDARGRQALSQALYALRRDTRVDDIVVGGEQLRLNPSAISSDVADFVSASEAGDHDAIAALYAGSFLDGVYVSDGDAFERWAETQRVRFTHVAESSLEHLAIRADAAGNHVLAITWWRRLTALDPLKTKVAVRLISALAASGERSEALRHADEYRRLVRQELDAEPNPDVTALAERLRTERNPRHLEGRFVIERELGRGAMGAVYLARDVKHDRLVALKMLLPEIGIAVGRARLEREIMLTARLQHPHILALYDSGEADGGLFYVMPFVDGESLRARLARESRLPIADALQIAREVADALQHAHSRGVIHRDIKPENILLANGHAVVADFGIARTVARAVGDTVTEHGLAIGTPAYMSPEQVAGGDDVDGRTDIFALGCVLYEMLTGRPPWIATARQALLARRFVEEPPSLRTLRSDVPRPVEEAVRKALAVEPDDRFATADAFAAALLATERSAISLPPPTGALVGRDQAVMAATALLERADVRLVTFTGAGGSGKTQLALHVVAGAAAQFAEVAFADLAPLSEPHLVLPAIAHALGIRDQPQRSTLESIAARIGHRRWLLLLDNFEHVAEAAPDISRLLGACPHLTIAVTSRVRVRIRGEHEFFVAPLALPELTAPPAEQVFAAKDSAAVQLFVRRATEARSDLLVDDAALRTIAQICVRLDGLPLAIELAAARARLLSLPAIFARLDHPFDLLTGGARDLPERHRTLRTAIAASYDLLPQRERRGWQRLAIFAGGCTLDAAATVIESSESETLDVVATLGDASLVRTLVDETGETRVTMLATLREFALEQLRDSGEEEPTRDRHRDFFVEFAERLAPELTGEAQASALARLEKERGNLRSALEWSERTDAATLMRLVLTLRRYWLVRGEWTVGRAWLHRAISLAADSVSGTDLAEALNAAGSLAQNQGDYATSFECQERALRLWRDAGARDGEARTLTSMGWLAWRQGRYVNGRRLSEEALRLLRTLNDEHGTAQALSNLGWIAIFEGRYREAEEYHSESTTIRRRLGDRRNIAFALGGVGWSVCRQGDLLRARTLVDEALALFREIGERQLYAFMTRVAAELALEEQRPADARAMLESTSIPVFRVIGDRWGVAFSLGMLADALVLENRLDEATRANDESMEIAQALDDRYAIASARAREAVLAAAEGAFERTAVAAALADDLLREMGGALGPFQRRMLDAAIESARAALGKERFDRSSRTIVAHAAMSPDVALK